MIDTIWLKAVVKAFVLPPTGPLVVAVLGLAVMRRTPRLGRALGIAGVGLLLVLSIPAVAVVLQRCVDTSPPLDLAQAKTAQAIVILGGGIRRHAPEYGGDTLGRLTLERVRYGARVARLTGLPVLVSGGSVLGGALEATLMREALEGEFGVTVRWSEDRSRDTHENAVLSAQILREEGIRRVVLVAHAFDMPRATAEFAAQDVEVVRAPTGIPEAAFGEPLMLVPGLAGLTGSYYALYEMLGNLVLSLRTALR